LRVDVAVRGGTPDAAIRLIVEAGASTAPASRAGLATLAGELLVEGAAGRSSIEMAEWLDALGASFRCQSTFDHAVLSMHSLTDQFSESLEFLSAVTRSPDFETQEVERVRDLRIDRIRRRNDEPAEIASERLAEAVFGAHPYGVPLDGTLNSVAALDADMLEAFWRARAVPSAATMVVCGDVDPIRVFEVVEDHFGDWAAGGTPAETVSPGVERPVRSGDVLLIDRPASRQTELRIAGVGFARGAEGEVPALLMNAILGGLFNSRINLNLREDKGWTYGARTMFARRRAAGPFLLKTAVDTEVTVGAFEQIRKEFEAMRVSVPTEDELALARNALTLTLPLRFETKGQITGHRVEAISYGLPDDYWRTFESEVRAVTPDDVLEAARRYLSPDGLVLLAVGDVARFAEELEEFGSVEVASAEPVEEAPGP
jgi:zinc protease